MKFTETELKGCFVINPTVWADERGYFFESFRQDFFKENTKSNITFIQDNESSSKYGVIRGLHIQKNPFAQAKLVRVIFGKIRDVAVDVRKESPTYGQHVEVELSIENKKQLFIPAGFLHGFSVLSETAVVAYKCNEYYNKNAEDGVNPLSESLNIDWGIPKHEAILSQKDLEAQEFSNFIAE